MTFTAVHVQPPVASPVALTTGVPKGLQHPRDGFGILESLKLGFFAIYTFGAHECD